MTAPRTLVVCGGGNGAHVLIADLGRRADWQVRLVTSRKEAWGAPVTCTEDRPASRWIFGTPRPEQDIYAGAPAGVFGWDELDAALAGADLVVLAGPVGAHRSMLSRLLPALAARDGALPPVGSLYAQGGFDWIARDLLRAHPALGGRLSFFGYKRYPFLCKRGELGRSVRLFRRFPKIVTAVHEAVPGDAQRVLSMSESLFERPATRLPGFLSCTLNMSNQMLHPGIAWGLFHDYVPGETVYGHHRKFYGECNRLATQSMQAIYQDLYLVTKALEDRTGQPLLAQLGADPIMGAAVQPRLKLLHRHGIDGLGPFHAVVDLVGMGCFRFNQAFKQVPAPMLPGPGGQGFVPDFSSRFWTDDIPDGLCVLYGLGLTLGLRLERIAALIRGHQRFMGKVYLDGDALGPDFSEANAPQRYGVVDAAGLDGLLGW